jgi:tRNA A58 N-methylase Trm61
MRFRCRPGAAFVALLVTLVIPVAASSSPQQPSSEIGADRIFEALRLHEGMTACEIGAGNGKLTIAAARVVGPKGRVYSSELGESRVTSLKRSAEDSGLDQITVIAGDPAKTNFPEGACDVVFMRNVYHHFDDPAAMNASIKQSLKPGGRVAVVDFKPRGHEAERPQDRDGGNGTHGVSAESVERELTEAGFRSISEVQDGDEGFMVVFTRGS